MATTEFENIREHLVVECGECKRPVGSFGYVPRDIAMDLLDEDALVRADATKEVLEEGRIRCASCHTEGERARAVLVNDDLASREGNNPCGICGFIAEMEFGRWRLCPHQVRDPSGRVVRA